MDCLCIIRRLDEADGCYGERIRRDPCKSRTKQRLLNKDFPPAPSRHLSINFNFHFEVRYEFGKACFCFLFYLYQCILWVRSELDAASWSQSIISTHEIRQIDPLFKILRSEKKKSSVTKKNRPPTRAKENFLPLRSSSRGLRSDQKEHSFLPSLSLLNFFTPSLSYIPIQQSY